MAKIGVPTSSLSYKTVPSGFYKLRLEGFMPQLAAKKDSVNLNPRFKVVSLAPEGCDLKAFAGQATLPDGNPVIVDGEPADGISIFAGINTKAGFIMEAMTHGCGFEMTTEVDPVSGDSRSNIPGTFPSNDDNDPPDKWGKYIGPLLHAECVVEVVEGESKKLNPATQRWEGTGQPRNEIKQFVCRVPGCEIRHSNNLIKN
jgi:hypothetical protein